jgi:hypothetical protein
MAMGGPPAWGLGMSLTTPHHKKAACYETSNSLELGWILQINDPSDRIWI